MRALVLLSAAAVGSFVSACGDFSADPPAAGGSSNAAAGSSSGGSSAGSGVIPGGAGGTGGASGGAGGSTAPGGSGGSGGRETPPTASCENITACGGEAAAVWFATSSCLNVSGKADLSKLGIGCTESESVMGKLDVSGNLTLNADGTMSDNTSTTGDIELELGPMCLNVSGTVTRCDRISSPLSSAGFDTLDCVDSTKTTGGCTCKGKVKQAGSAGWVFNFPPQMGEWKAEANSLKLKTSETDVDYGYCVEGNFMKVTPTTKAPLGTVVGSVVFQKQQ